MDDEDAENIEEQFSDGDGSTEDSSESEDDAEVNPTWSSRTSGLGFRDIPFTGNPGLLVPIPGNNRPIDWFMMLIDIVFLEKIVSETNRYAMELFCGPATTPKSRVTAWKDLTVQELKTFIGLLFHTGTVRLNKLQDYWKTSRLFNFPFFRQYMSRDRFLIILRCLHFSRPGTEERPEPANDRLYKVRYLVEYFNNKMRQIYYPNKDLTIDEEMILWRGRLVFRQYIKGKRHKYGIKVYSVNEPDGLLLRFHIYTGQTDPTAGKGHTVNVVLNLMKDFLGKGHSLYMDNFYNSFILASKLLRRDTYCTGTLRADRKHNPAAVKSANLNKGATIANYAESIMVAKWRDKRTVLYLSSQFDNEMVQTTNKRKVQKVMPKPILYYNVNMKGVDRMDQMLSYYPCERKTLRWPKKIFLHMLQMILVNAFYLYNAYNVDNKLPLYDFRLKVIEELLPPKEAPPVQTPPGRNSNSVHRVVKNEERDGKGGAKRKRCRACFSEGKRKQTTYVCSACPGKPGLCEVGQCFEKFHENVK